jgi:hypothetical protein
VRCSLDARRRRRGIGFDQGTGHRQLGAGSGISSQEKHREENFHHHFRSLELATPDGSRRAGRSDTGWKLRLSRYNKKHRERLKVMDHAKWLRRYELNSIAEQNHH